MTVSALPKIAGMNYHYCRYPLEFFLDSMERLGIDAIELWAAAPHFYLEDLSAAAMGGIRRQLRSRGLKLVCLTPEQCVYPVNLAGREPALRGRSLAYFLKHLEAASELGSPLLLVTAGCGYFSEPREEAWRRSRESLAKLARRAEQLGITLALEPLSPASSNLINGLTQLMRMVAEIRSPCLKGMLDTVQMAILGEEVDAYFRVLGRKLVHVHLVDGAPQNHLAWGDGVLPLRQYLRALAKYEYEGFLTLEICDRRYFHAPEQAVRKSLNCIRKAGIS